jgi:DNA-directed RNA polymerase
MSTREALVESWNRRARAEISPNEAISFLREINTVSLLDDVISTLYLFTRPSRGSDVHYFTDVANRIGGIVRRRLSLPLDTGTNVRAGAFLLYTFEELGITTVGQAARNNHAAYTVVIKDEEALKRLWGAVPATRTTQMPSLTTYAPWRAGIHSNGKKMIKTGNKEILAKLDFTEDFLLFENLNKSQAIGWNVSEEVVSIAKWALRIKADAFLDIWEASNREAKATKLRESETILEIANKFLHETFYHQYYYDFRGRKYCSTAYLHEQGPDLSKGILVIAKKKSLGDQGYFWLLVSIATNWGGASHVEGVKTDKLPLAGRAEWVMANEEWILECAVDPRKQDKWMEADSPWQFLSNIIVLRDLRVNQASIGDFNDYSFETGIVVYIDGSNNGSQHLAAMTHDEVTAPHVNLAPSELPGDLYAYVAEYAWQSVQKECDELTEEEIAECNQFIDELINLKAMYQKSTPKSEERELLGAMITVLKQENDLLSKISAPVYWSRIKDLKERRKIVKRNVMTVPYGGSRYGMGEQQIDDAKKHGIQLLMAMEHRWGGWMGSVIFETCQGHMNKPMKLLKIFEAAGARAEAEERYLEWTTPLTNFPVCQFYVEGQVKKVWVQYGPKYERASTGKYVNTFQLRVAFPELPIMSKRKQAQGASPNAIHSLDAAHLCLTVNACPFDIVTIHDSFGSHPSDMPELFRIVREQFVALYRAEPLAHLMHCLQTDASHVEIGTLDLDLILQSEFAFA